MNRADAVMTTPVPSAPSAAAAKDPAPVGGILRSRRDGSGTRDATPSDATAPAPDPDPNPNAPPRPVPEPNPEEDQSRIRTRHPRWFESTGFDRNRRREKKTRRRLAASSPFSRRRRRLPPRPSPLSMANKTATVSCPPGLVGRVIGKGGETIKGLQAQSGAHIAIDQRFPEGVDRVVTVSGPAGCVDTAVALVEDVLRGDPTSGGGRGRGGVSGGVGPWAGAARRVPQGDGRAGHRPRRGTVKRQAHTRGSRPTSPPSRAR